MTARTCEALVNTGTAKHGYRECHSRGPVEAVTANPVVNSYGDTSTPVVVHLCRSHQHQLAYMYAGDYPHCGMAIRHERYGDLVGNLEGYRINMVLVDIEHLRPEHRAILFDE